MNYDSFSIPLSIISCSLSCLASIAIVITFLLWKDIRSGLRWVITYLAIADFFTAASYLLDSFNKIAFTTYSQHGAAAAAAACKRFDSVCQIQSFMSSWSSMSSFIWTTVLAFYLYWTIVKKEVRSINRLFPLYHLLAWGLPMVIVLPLLVTSKLGYSHIATSGWCYIRTDQTGGENTNLLTLQTIGLIFVGGKAMEIASYVIVISLYCGVFCNINREVCIHVCMYTCMSVYIMKPVC